MTPSSANFSAKGTNGGMSLEGTLASAVAGTIMGIGEYSLLIALIVQYSNVYGEVSYVGCFEARACGSLLFQGHFTPVL